MGHREILSELERRRWSIEEVENIIKYWGKKNDIRLF